MTLKKLIFPWHSLVISERVIVMGKRNIFIMETLPNISLQDLLKHPECRLVFRVNMMADYFRPFVVSIIVSQ